MLYQLQAPVFPISTSLSHSTLSLSLISPSQYHTPTYLYMPTYAHLLTYSYLPISIFVYIIAADTGVCIGLVCSRRLWNYLSCCLILCGLQEFSYGNATTEDLWKFLSLSSGGKDIKSVMTSWIQEMGFPVVKVVLEPPSGGDTNNTVTFLIFFKLI